MKRDQGRLVEWFDEKGYGFIQSDHDKEHKVFLHIQDFAKKGPRPLVGCALDYAVAVDSDGRIRAKDVIYLKASQTQKKFDTRIESFSKQNSNLDKMTIGIIFYWLVIFILLNVGKLPHFYFLWLILVNALTYFAYRRDKNAVQFGLQRIPELTFHLLAMLGGWSFAWFAQQKFRHKTQKQPFKKIFFCTVVLNILFTIGMLILLEQ